MFQSRDTYNDDKKSHITSFKSYWSTRLLFNYNVSGKKFAEMASQITEKEKSNSYSAYSFSEYCQSNATLKSSNIHDQHFHCLVAFPPRLKSLFKMKTCLQQPL